MSEPRTTVTMIAAGPDGAVFGIFRARVRNPRKRWTWDVHRATRIGTVTVPAGAVRRSYRAMAEQFATADWPALDYPTWQA